jgi:flagellar basal-body rod protein FlgB
LANAEVPNFKRSEVNFESALKAALESEERRPRVELRRSAPAHISNHRPLDYRSVEPRRVLDYLTQTKANGNNVDAETEFNLLVQNQMRYMLLSQAATHEFGQINSVLRA